MKIKGKFLSAISALLLLGATAACTDDPDKEPVSPAPSTVPSVAPSVVDATPPPLLPDGTEATNPTTSESDTPATGGVKAPKGIPPVPGDEGQNSTVAYQKKDPTEYFYAGANQAAATKGVFADVRITKPYLSNTTYHSLGEISVQGGTNNHSIVEVGSTADRVINNGSSEPHLFVFHWVNNQPACYNGCGFVNYGGATLRPGMEVPENTVKRMGIQYHAGNWWVSYDRGWVGYFPGTLWSSAGETFTQSGVVQLFGEVVSTVTNPCEDMGTGNLSSNTAVPASSKASFTSVTYVNGPTVNLSMMNPTNSTYYSNTAISNRSFYYGGPGNGGVVNGC